MHFGQLPFDSQRCYVTLAPLAGDGGALRLTGELSGLELVDVSNVEWSVAGRPHTALAPPKRFGLGDARTAHSALRLELDLTRLKRYYTCAARPCRRG